MFREAVRNEVARLSIKADADILMSVMHEKMVEFERAQQLLGTQLHIRRGAESRDDKYGRQKTDCWQLTRGKKGGSRRGGRGASTTASLGPAPVSAAAQGSASQTGAHGSGKSGDTATHFKGAVVRMMAEKLGVTHHFAVK